MLKTITFSTPTTLEIKTAYQELVKQPGVQSKVNVTFSEPVLIRINVQLKR